MIPIATDNLTNKIEPLKFAIKKKIVIIRAGDRQLASTAQRICEMGPDKKF